MSSGSYPPSLTQGEKLDLIPASLSLIASGVYAAISGVFRGENGAKYYGKHVSYAVIRTLLDRTSIRQKQYVT